MIDFKKKTFLFIAVLVGAVFLMKYVSPEENSVAEKENLIRVFEPRVNEKISSPMWVRGEARGFWFFEASFPLRLVDEKGKELGFTLAQTLSDWMTEDFVGFEATLEFQTPAGDRGVLILEKDNPSGLPEHDDSLSVPVRFGR